MQLAQSVFIDDLNTPSIGSPFPATKLVEHYRTIGRTLSICEAGSIQAGIPWLPPSYQKRELSRQFNPPLGEFLRYSLLGIPNHVLQSYVDDLKLPKHNTKLQLDLHLSMLNLWERMSMPVAIFLLSSALVFLTIQMVSQPLPLEANLVYSILGGLLTGFLTLNLCTESFRRTSFRKLLRQELLRRCGLDQGNVTTLPLIQAKTKPINEI